MRAEFPEDELLTQSRWSDVIWKILTVLTVIVLMCVLGSTLLIFFDPYSVLNPFPPPTLPAPAQLPSETPTDVVFEMPSTWTPTPTIAPTASGVPSASATLPPTPTPITITPSATAEYKVPEGGYPFQVRQGNPKAIPNIYHPELVCDWMGVGGQVIDMSNAPLIGLIVKLGGSLPNTSLLDETFTLTGLALSYGRSGYEFTLADRPIASSDQLWVQLVSQDGYPLSERVIFDTYDSCEQNLIIIDFVQVR